MNGWSANFLSPDASEIETVTSVETEGNTVKVALNDHPLGTANGDWSFTVLIGSYDFSSSGNRIFFH